AHRNNHQVVKHAFNRQVDVNQFGNGQLHQRQKNALHRFAHVSILLWGLAYDRGRVNWIIAMRHTRDVKNRIEVFQGIETGMIAKGPFGPEFIEIDVALQHDLRRGWNFQIDGFTLDQFNWPLAQKSGDQIFLNVRRRRNDGGESDGGIGADGNGNIHLAGRQI